MKNIKECLRRASLTDSTWLDLIELPSVQTAEFGTDFKANILLQIERLKESILPVSDAVVLAEIEAAISKTTKLANSKFFKIFCPEPLRNAIDKIKFPAASIVYLAGKFVWKSETAVEIKLADFPVFALVNARVGDLVTITVIGTDKVESINLKNSRFPDEDVIYYLEPASSSFGNLAYSLKKAVLANK